MADTFISYAREDTEFVRRLVAALTAAKREPWVDWEGIVPADQWMDSVRDAIDASDAFVFIISADSVASATCGLELAHAAQQHKRLVPVVWREPDGDVPVALAALNWIFLRESDDFDAGVEALIRALETDIDLVRTQTRVLTRAKAWELGGRRTSPLLRGEELHQAEAWLARAASGAEPKPTDLQAAFVSASRRASSRRQRRAVAASLGVALFAVALSLVAVTQRNRARAQRRLALSRQLTAQSQAQLDSDPQLAVLLAKEALRVDPTDDVEFEAVAALDRSFLTRILHGPGRDVLDVAYSPDGTQLAMTDVDGVTSLWRTSDWTRTGDLTTDHRGVVRVRYSPDGRLLATANLAGAARIWDLKTAKVVTELTGHTASLTDLAFSPDGSRIATSSTDTTARIWDVASGRELVRIQAADQLLGIAFSPDGTRVATAGLDGLVVLWDAASGAKIRALRGHTVAAEAVAFSPDGSQLASAGGDATVRVWDVATGRAGRVFDSPIGVVFAVAFSPDGRLVAAAGEDPSIRVWDAHVDVDLEGIPNPRVEPVHVLRGHRQLVQGLAFSPDGKTLVSASGDTTARVWRVGSVPGAGTAVVFDDRALSTYPIPSVSVGVSPDSTRIAIGSGQGVVHVIDAASRSVLYDIDGGGTYARAEFSPDGSMLAVGDDRGTTLHAAADGQLTSTLALPQGVFSLQFAFRPTAPELATADQDGMVRLWDTGSGRLLRTIATSVGRDGEATAVVFSADGATLAIGTQLGDVTLFDPDTGKSVGVLPRTSPVNDLRFTPDGGRLVVAGATSDVHLWDLHGKAFGLTLRGHTRPVLRLALSTDGRTLVTASQDHTARVWDMASGRVLRVLFGHADWVDGVAIVPSTDGVLTASVDGRTVEWDPCTWCASAELLSKRLDAATVRCFTADERRTLLGDLSATVDEACAA